MDNATQQAIIALSVQVVLMLAVAMLRKCMHKANMQAMQAQPKTASKSTQASDAHEGSHMHHLTAFLDHQGQTKALNHYLESCRNCIFTSHKRTRENFVKDNVDPTLILPPPYGAERAICSSSYSVLYSILCRSNLIRDALLEAVFLALLGGALTSVVWLGHQIDLGAIPRVTMDIWRIPGEQLRWLTGFLLLGIIGVEVNRWTEWLVNCHTVQARIHDLGLIAGSSIKDPSDLATRTALFRLYRYLNVVHAMTYASITPNLPQTSDGYVSLGLLSQQELRVLLPMQNKQRDTILSWIGGVLEDLILSGKVRELAIPSTKVSDLRGICARHHDLFVRNCPNIYRGVCRCIVDLTIISLLPTHVDMVGQGNYTRILPSIFLTTVAGFMTSAAYLVAWSIISILDNPFITAGIDVYNPDALMASTERCLFANMRGLFDSKERLKEEGNPTNSSI